MSCPRTADSSGRAGIAARRPCIHRANNASYVLFARGLRYPGPQVSSIRALIRVPLGAALVSISALRGNELAGVTHKPKVRVIPGLPRLIANVLGLTRVSLIRSLAANSPTT